MTLQPALEGLGDYTIRERTRMVLALASVREEWQATVNGGSLLKVETTVGLFLVDIVEKLQLSAQERHIVLGGRLINELDAFMETRVARKLFA